MLAARMSRIAQTGAEVLVSLVLAILFFGIFLVILNNMFPIGGGLKHNQSDSGWGGSFGVMEQTVSDLLMMRGDEEVPPEGKVTAKLANSVNTVKVKRSGRIAWRGIGQGAKLFDGDGVQTAKKSRALVMFNNKNFLRMGENSLVIIRRMEHDAILPQNQSVVVMAEGEVWGRVEHTGTEKAYLEVTTPAADARIRSHAGTGAAEFKITVNQDKSSTVSVFKGQVEISAKGKSVIVSENEQADVQIGEVPAAPRKMLDSVMLERPHSNTTLAYRDLPPRVRFAWLPVDGAAAYQFMLAKDPQFREMVAETRVKDTKFYHGNLANGRYYWRIRASQKGREGALSESRELRLVQDRTAPSLRVKFPPAITHRREHTISGATEPGARIFVAGKATRVDEEGQFETRMKLKRGLNVIVVESVDVAGNVQYRSKTINGKF
jgi:hypothetical protein